MTEDELRSALHEDDDLAQNIKRGLHKNRRLPVRVVDCAHNISALREMLDVLAGAAQRARAKLDDQRMPYHIRFLEMDLELDKARRRLDEIADAQPAIVRRKREARSAPIIRLNHREW